MARKPRKKKPVHSYIIAAMRKIWYWSDERKAAVKRAKQGPDLIQCENPRCRKLMPEAAVAQAGKKKPKRLWAVDHINPCVPPSTGFSNWDDYLKRLFVPADQLQVLCNPCHQKKTNKENQERRAHERKQTR